METDTDNSRDRSIINNQPVYPQGGFDYVPWTNEDKSSIDRCPKETRLRINLFTSRKKGILPIMQKLAGETLFRLYERHYVHLTTTPRFLVSRFFSQQRSVLGVNARDITDTLSDKKIRYPVSPEGLEAARLLPREILRSFFPEPVRAEIGG